MENKLISLVIRICALETTDLPWFKDELDGHLRIGTPKGPCFDYSWGILNDVPFGNITVRRDERTALHWPLTENSELHGLICILMEQSTRVREDQAYRDRLENEEELVQMIATLEPLIAKFFNRSRQQKP